MGERSVSGLGRWVGSYQLAVWAEAITIQFFCSQGEIGETILRDVVP